MATDRQLAIRTPRGALRLPEAHAADAVAAFFAGYGVEGVRTTTDAIEAGVALDAGAWAIILPLRADAVLRRVVPKAQYATVSRTRTAVVLVQPIYSLALKGQSAKRLKWALNDVLPKQDNGLPFPWVVPAAESEPLGRAPDPDDVVPAGTPLPPIAEHDAETPLTSEIIRADFERIRQHLGLADFPLTIRRGAVPKHGFVTGRVHLRGATPVRMVITTCPNADRAEAAATLAHEFAHVLTPGAGHDARFKAALVDLAEALWGAAHLRGARDALAGSYASVDAWIATGIRARLAGAAPPFAIDPEEARVAIVVRRVQKLRALARDQRGTPEGVSAAATANDLIVTHGLGTYRVALPGDLGAEMCDRWLLIGKRQPWRAQVAFAVARFCDVFALQHTGYGGMHLFGRSADVITAEHLFGVAIERITARCAQHMQRWRAAHPLLKGGAARSQRTSFLHSAAYGLRQALDPTPDSTAIAVAEEFARVEHTKRGSGWSAGRGRGHRHNPAGFQAGQSVRLSKPVGGGGPTGLLPS